MSLVSFLEQPSKNNSVSLTLDKATLEGLSQVSSDPYWSVDANVSRVIVHYLSTEGNQRKILTFNYQQETPSTTVDFSGSARDVFEINMLVLVDNDNGIMVLSRDMLDPQIDLSLLDIDIST
jgi:hypothetical protein